LEPGKVHLVIATPCYGGMVTQRYMQSICALLLAATQDGLPVTVEFLGNDSLITRARNTLVATALDNPAATHLMFIDADIGFTPQQVARMLGFDRDVVAGMYPLKLLHNDEAMVARVAAGEPLETAQIRYVGAPLPADLRRDEDGFMTAEFAGTGFMLIKRQALERMIEAYPETRYGAAHDRAVPNESPHKYALFDCTIDPQTGDYLSEDFTFCRRWRAIGGEVWLDARSSLIHVGPREFAGDAQARFCL
jgi:hypothetical protein